MRSEDLAHFCLLGHDCPVGRYPSPVVPIGKLGDRLVAIYRSEEGDPEPVEIAEHSKFVLHSADVALELGSFNAVTDLLFAMSPNQIASYDAISEMANLLVFRQANDDPFYRLALSSITDYEEIIAQDLRGCLQIILSTAPELAESWYSNWRGRLQARALALSLPPDSESFLHLNQDAQASQTLFPRTQLHEAVNELKLYEGAQQFPQPGSLVQLQDVHKVFYGGEVETYALNGINLSIDRGEFVVLTGPSGCGKSTLLSIIGLLDTPTGGKYELNGRPVENLKFAERSRIRNQEIGFIFQSFNLMGDLTVAENVELPLTYRSGMASSDRLARVQESLERVGMAHRMRHYPSQLSGGQQQRVAVARALAGSPSILLADEPTGNLDSKNGEAVMELLKNLHREGATICLVTHDPRYIRYAERFLGMYDGRIVDRADISMLIPSR